MKSANDVVAEQYINAFISNITMEKKVPSLTMAQVFASDSFNYLEFSCMTVSRNYTES